MLIPHWQEKGISPIRQRQGGLISEQLGHASFGFADSFKLLAPRHVPTIRIPQFAGQSSDMYGPNVTVKTALEKHHQR